MKDFTTITVSKPWSASETRKTTTTGVLFTTRIHWLHLLATRRATWIIKVFLTRELENAGGYCFFFQKSWGLSLTTEGISSTFRALWTHDELSYTSLIALVGAILIKFIRIPVSVSFWNHDVSSRRSFVITRMSTEAKLPFFPHSWVDIKKDRMCSVCVTVRQRYREEQLLYRPTNGNKKVDLLLFDL